MKIKTGDVARWLSGMEWIELGHYASEIIGLEKAAQVIGKQFPGIPVTCYYDSGKFDFR